MLKHLLSTTTVALILSGAVGAQTHDTVIATEGATQMRADSLIGMTVLTTDGAVVGDVTDLILDQDDRLRGLIVSTGGLLGFGGRDVGVSWDQAEVRSAPETNDPIVVLNLMRADIKAAPDFKTQEDVEAEQPATGVEQQFDQVLPTSGGMRP
ncbi:PRC-barrel domain-containing protein [Rhodospirillaceae bacterium SYSU D60014]|uniref:PRC-barrel domain-containing protein n=1 Tax=Virgifigura deserti TaxID=2268457 RepID=UPI000E672D76